MFWPLAYGIVQEVHSSGLNVQTSIEVLIVPMHLSVNRVADPAAIHEIATE